MPTYTVQGPDGRTYKIQGPQGATAEQLAAVIQSQQVAPQPQTLQEQMQQENINPASIMTEVAEPLLTMASGFGSTLFGGLKGLGALPFVGSEQAAQMVRDTQENGTYLPRTAEGRRGLAGYGAIADSVSDAVNVPLSYAGGALELATGQGLERAGETVRSIQERGFSDTAGDRTLEESNSPGLATLANVAPEAVGMMFPIARAGAARHAAKDEIRRELLAGSTDESVAGYRLTDGSGNRVGALEQAADGPPRLPPPGSNGAEMPGAQPPVPWKMKVEKDDLQQKVIDQGVDKSVVAAISQASPADRKLMREMLERMQKIRTNKRASADTDKLPRTVIGDTLKTRVDALVQTKKQAGKELDAAVEKSKTLPVVHSNAVDAFQADLAKHGIRLDIDPETGRIRPNFEDADFEGHDQTERFISKLIARMDDTKVRSANDAHRLKKWIDANVNWTVPQEGLKGSAEAIAKQLRGRLNKALQDKVPGYRDANTKYADTRGVLKELQRMTGRTDLESDASAGKLGTLMRRLTSNAASRSEVETMVEQADAIARKYGADFGDDVKNLQTFANELDRYFGSVADTSFQAEIGKGIQRAAVDMATGQPGGALAAVNESVLSRTINSIRGVNSENAYKALADLLEAQ